MTAEAAGRPVSPSKLGLGTVQFGTHYGIANRAGAPNLGEVSRILAEATAHGITLFDTAPAYGDSEAKLGAALPDAGSVRIVTKTPRLSGTADRPDWREFFRTGLEQSLTRLGRPSLYGILLHNVPEILGEKREPVVDALKMLRRAGMVEKIGASIYDSMEVPLVIDWAQIVQLPFNVFNQSHWHSGNMTRLHDKGVEIHVRSVLLQGLVTLAPDQLQGPFVSLRLPLEKFHRTCGKAGVSPLAASIAFACSNPLVDAVIVGVERSEQLQPLLDASRADVSEIDFSVFDGTLGELGDPRRWPV